jgi:hypothetical protein
MKAQIELEKNRLRSLSRNKNKSVRKKIAYKQYYITKKQ